MLPSMLSQPTPREASLLMVASILHLELDKAQQAIEVDNNIGEDNAIMKKRILMIEDRALASIKNTNSHQSKL
jgi:hypothetical protein